MNATALSYLALADAEHASARALRREGFQGRRRYPNHARELRAMAREARARIGRYRALAAESSAAA